MNRKRPEIISRIKPQLGRGARRVRLSLGQWVLQTVDRYLNLCALWSRLLIGSFHRTGRRLIFRETLNQIYLTSMQGIFFIIYTSLILGLLVIIHASQQLMKIQGEENVGLILVTLVIREVGPVGAAFYVVLHSATAIMVELGNMSVTGEIESLRTMGVDPYRFLGIPRFWGVIIGVVTLYVIGSFMAILGGFLFAQIFATIYWGDFWRSFLNALQWTDLAAGFGKSIAFGMLIATVAIYFGFKPQNNLGEVARYTSKGAILCLIMGATLDSLVVTIYYLFV